MGNNKQTPIHELRFTPPAECPGCSGLGRRAHPTKELWVDCRDCNGTGEVDPKSVTS